MPPTSTPCRLVGFAAELDWRPLHFVRPIPRNKVCSACGLVRRMNALLPCMHALCRSCYEQCDGGGIRVCPLDGEKCLDDDIDWKEYATEELLKREVHCWNEEHGCGAVMAASEISHHFQRQCGHHPAHCPKCSTTVLCSDVCAHLTSNCATPGSPLASGSGRPPSNNEDAVSSASLREALEEQAGEIKIYLERLVADVGTHGDRLNEMSHSINTFKETLTQELTRDVRQIRESVTKSEREISFANEQMKERLVAWNNNPASLNALEKTVKDFSVHLRRQSSDNCSRIVAVIQEVKEDCRKTLDRIITIQRRDELRAAHTVFDVRGMKSLRDKALKNGYAEYVSEPVYLCGYCMSPGIALEKPDSVVKLCALLCLHKGEMDDVLLWPFEHKIKLSIIHPQPKPERQLELKPFRTLENYVKPISPSNQPALFLTPSLNFADLWRDGYVSEDQLRVKWEVLP
ncbi:uncharacterized protein LOC144128314 [Amblyomma americanum]